MAVKQQPGTPLLRQFATLSLLIIGLITIGLSLVVSHYLRKDLLEREWRFTADFIRTEALYHLRPEDFVAPLTSHAQERFQTLYQQTVLMPEILRVKIYDPAMMVVWSNESRLIGQRFPDNPHLVSALTGQTRVNLAIEEKGENVYEREGVGRLVEVYVPISFPGTTQTAGVVETYKLPEQVFRNIRRGQFVVVGTTVAGALILYLSLFWIVRRAARRIDSQQALTARLQAVREEERARVAREIHDELGQTLTALKIDLAWWTGRLPAEPPALRDTAQRMLALVDTTIQSARRLFTDLRPAILDELGLAAALDWLAKAFQERTGIQCGFIFKEEEVALDPEMATTLFRICQEALSNVERHAGATQVIIREERQADALLLSVEDNGKGITDREIAHRKSLGLMGMRERAILLGGELTILGRPGEGTTVTVRMPLS
ncbi:MAG TPA: sensor histidine kinase [Candidatus Methylomirabilis sp.]|nr:sensor histidine kinase [Candidatus Methylomirabilis sp.]